jgi:hypothetical protein
LILNVSTTCSLDEATTQPETGGGAGGSGQGAAGAPSGSQSGTGGTASTENPASSSSGGKSRGSRSAGDLIDNSAVIGGCACSSVSSTRHQQFYPIAGVLAALLFAFQRRVNATKLRPRSTRRSP